VRCLTWARQGRYHLPVALAPPLVFPPVVPGEPIVLSATTFVTYARHLIDGPIAEAGFGAACREEIGASMNPKLAALGLRPSQLDGIIEEAAGLYRRFCRLGVEGLAGAEVELEAEPAPGVTLRGVVDAVFDDGVSGIRLTDWKTGSLGDPASQLGFYALLWVLERGELPGRVEAVSLASGERTEEVPTRAGIEEAASAAATAVSQLRTAIAAEGHLERSAGPWCRWCPLLDECKEGRATTALLEG
jgi:hypothetical protein